MLWTCITKKFLSPKDVRNKFDTVLIRSKQLNSLPILKEVDAEKGIFNEAKAKEKVILKRILNYSKVQAIIHCGEWIIERAMNSMYEYGGNKK